MLQRGKARDNGQCERTKQRMGRRTMLSGPGVEALSQATASDHWRRGATHHLLAAAGNGFQPIFCVKSWRPQRKLRRVFFAGRAVHDSPLYGYFLHDFHH